MSTERRCENCSFWDRTGRECHRNPPDPERENHRPWPYTAPHDWCGEFAPKGTITLQASIADAFNDPAPAQEVTRIEVKNCPHMVLESSDGIFTTLQPNGPFNLRLVEAEGGTFTFRQGLTTTITELGRIKP